MLAARHIGGIVSGIAVGQAFQIDPFYSAVALTYDALTTAAAFSLANLARVCLPFLNYDVVDPSVARALGDVEASASREWALPAPLEGLQALGVSAAICATGAAICHRFSVQSLVLPVVTLLGLAAATLLPNLLAPLAPAGESLGLILTQLFLATLGASVPTLPVWKKAGGGILFLVCSRIIAARAAITLGASIFFRLSPWNLVLVCNTNVGDSKWRGTQLQVFLLAAEIYIIVALSCF